MLGHVPLQELSGSMLNAFYRSLGDKGLSSTTIHRVHATLHRALHDAVRWSKVARNAADVADPPKSSTPYEPQVWNAEQLARFFDHVQTDRLYPVYVTSTTTGLRRGDLLGLRPKDVHLDSGRLEIHQSLTSVNYKLEVSPPKSGRTRSVSIDRVTVEALRAWRKRVAEERLLWGPAYNDSGFFFCREDGSPIHPGNFSKAFERHVKRSGLPRTRLHDLRHASATIALEGGVHPKVVSERLGHATIAITLDIYSHVVPTMDAAAAEEIAGRIFQDRR